MDHTPSSSCPVVRGNTAAGVPAQEVSSPVRPAPGLSPWSATQDGDGRKGGQSSSRLQLWRPEKDNIVLTR